MFHAFYSQKSAEQSGTVIWEDEQGNKINVTAVVDENDYTPERFLSEYYMWDDARYLGKVVKYISGTCQTPRFY